MYIFSKYSKVTEKSYCKIKLGYVARMFVFLPCCSLIVQITLILSQIPASELPLSAAQAFHFWLVRSQLSQLLTGAQPKVNQSSWSQMTVACRRESQTCIIRVFRCLPCCLLHDPWFQTAFYTQCSFPTQGEQCTWDWHGSMGKEWSQTREKASGFCFHSTACWFISQVLVDLRCS